MLVVMIMVWMAVVMVVVCGSDGVGGDNGSL